MGSEEALAGISVRNLVSCILELLDADASSDHAGEEAVIFELKNLSCNVLSHLMDVVPKAADAVVLAVPLLISTMSCSFVGDILERVINVLEQVSRRHGRQVLVYGGVTVSSVSVHSNQLEAKLEQQTVLDGDSQHFGTPQMVPPLSPQSNKFSCHLTSLLHILEPWPSLNGLA